MLTEVPNECPGIVPLDEDHDIAGGSTIDVSGYSLKVGEIVWSGDPIPVAMKVDNWCST